MTQTISGTVGCDLGDKRSELYCVADDGAGWSVGAIPTTRDGFRKMFEEIPSVHVVIEAGTHSRWVALLLTELGHRVTVANPRRLKLISQNNSKRDQTDAELLARLGRVDIGLLAPVTHRSAEMHEDLLAILARARLVDCRTKLVNQVRGLAKAQGYRVDKCEAEQLTKRAREQLPKGLTARLTPLLKAIDELTKQIKASDKTISAIAKRYPDVELLTQVHGIGELIALTFILVVGDPKRFKKSRQVGAYLGLRPKKDQSGDTDKQLPITKAGNPLLRRLLVISANYILSTRGKDSDLRRWGLELAKTGGKRGKQRAKVAVARKLAVLLHRLWTTGEVYEPIGYGKPKAEAA